MGKDFFEVAYIVASPPGFFLREAQRIPGLSHPDRRRGIAFAGHGFPDLGKTIQRQDSSPDRTEGPKDRNAHALGNLLNSCFF